MGSRQNSVVMIIKFLSLGTQRNNNKRYSKSKVLNFKWNVCEFLLVLESWFCYMDIEEF